MEPGVGPPRRCPRRRPLVSCRGWWSRRPHPAADRDCSRAAPRRWILSLSTATPSRRAWKSSPAVETVDDRRFVVAEHRDLSSDLIYLLRFRSLTNWSSQPMTSSTSRRRRPSRPAIDRPRASWPRRSPRARAPFSRRASKRNCQTSERGPFDEGTLAGVLVRSLVAARIEVTATAPLAACATPGCTGTFTPTRNRLYCDACRTARSRAAVRRTRAAASHGLSERTGPV